MERERQVRVVILSQKFDSKSPSLID